MIRLALERWTRTTSEPRASGDDPNSYYTGDDFQE